MFPGDQLVPVSGYAHMLPGQTGPARESERLFHYPYYSTELQFCQGISFKSTILK